MFQFRNCFCLCRTADCTGISLHTCCCISCFLCHYTFVIGMFICLCDFLCLGCSADRTGVELFSCFFAGRLFGYFTFIEGMCCISVFLCVVCDVAFAPLVSAFMPVCIFIECPFTAPYMIMFLCVVIGVMEYDCIAIFQILLIYCKFRMAAIQSVHPSTVCAIVFLSKFSSICFCNR